MGGKTGTANKIDPETGKYVEKYVASFVGLVPAKRPRLAILVMVDDADEVGAYRGGVGRAAGDGAFVTTWQAMNSSLFGALQVERNVMFLILTLIILVAALNIISGMMMLVKDKSRDIAVLRTMGATRGAMMRVFLITGSSIGVLGAVAGFVLGVLCAVTINVLLMLSGGVELDID